MAINFYLQSKKNPSNIYVRIREGREIDAKAKTNFKVDPEHFKKGKITFKKVPAGAFIEVKKEWKMHNDSLLQLQSDLDLLRFNLTTAINNKKDYETLNSDWLKDILNPKTDIELPTDLVGYFDYYGEVKKNAIKPGTLDKIKVFRNRIEAFQKDHGKIYIQEVNKKLGKALERWCDKKGYAHNTKVETLKMVFTMCNHAKENGMVTHPEYEYISKGLKYQKCEKIYLNFDEINKISSIEIVDERLDIARDWLIISCYTAQRVSDFLRFTKNKIRFSEGEFYLDISQEKTGTPVEIPLMPEVMRILEKRNGEFPPIFSRNTESNKTIYNKLIKEVCKMAKVNEMVVVQKRNKKSNRYEEVEIAKYKAVSTHIGRRSFATNYYGLIDISLLMTATGHKSEAQFLKYVGRAGSQRSRSLAAEMRKVNLLLRNEPQLRVIKNVSNF